MPLMMKSQNNQAIVMAFAYDGASVTLTWDIQRSICFQVGSSQNYIVAEQCDWALQQFIQSFKANFLSKCTERI